MVTHVIPSRRVPFSMSRDYAHSPILFPVGERDVAWIGRDGRAFDIAGSKAIVRMTPDGRSAVALAVVNRSYKLVHNKELFNAIADTMEATFSPASLHDAYCVDHYAQHGRTCWRDYVFPSIACSIGPGNIAMRIIVKNGYGGSALKLHSGAIDGFCANGMIYGDFDTYYKRHTSGLVIDGIQQRINEAIAAYTDGAGTWKRWAEIPVTRDQTMAFFKAITTTGSVFDVLSTQWLDEVETRGRNLWSVYSAMTYYSSHTGNGRHVDDDKVDSVLHRRELTVAKWVQSDEWRKLEHAA